MAEFKEDLTATYRNSDRGKIVNIAAGKSAYIYPNAWKKADGSHDESTSGTKPGPLVLGTATGNTYRDDVNETDYLEVLTTATFIGAESVPVGAVTITLIFVQPGQVVLEENADYDKTKDTGNDQYKKPTLPNIFKKETTVAKEGEGLPVVGDNQAILIRLKSLEEFLANLGKTGNPQASDSKPSTGLTMALWGVMGLAIVAIGIIIYRAGRKKPANA